jgi:hypothetical protein
MHIQSKILQLISNIHIIYLITGLIQYQLQFLSVKLKHNFFKEIKQF